MFAIRGATTCENTQQSITDATIELWQDIFNKNNLSYDTISAIVFSATPDLDTFYPAKALRDNFELADTPMFCTAEMAVKNSLKQCIRVLVFVNGNVSKNDVKHCYLRKASSLRPDLQ